jgi:hypothetical protein
MMALLRDCGGRVKTGRTRAGLVMSDIKGRRLAGGGSDHRPSVERLANSAP